VLVLPALPPPPAGGFPVWVRTSSSSDDAFAGDGEDARKGSHGLPALVISPSPRPSEGATTTGRGSSLSDATDGSWSLPNSLVVLHTPPRTPMTPSDANAGPPSHIPIDVFVRCFNRRHPGRLHPLLAVQQQIRKIYLGPRFWEGLRNGEFVEYARDTGVDSNVFALTRVLFDAATGPAPREDDDDAQAQESRAQQEQQHAQQQEQLQSPPPPPPAKGKGASGSPPSPKRKGLRAKLKNTLSTSRRQRQDQSEEQQQTPTPPPTPPPQQSTSPTAAPGGQQQQQQQPQQQQQQGAMDASKPAPETPRSPRPVSREYVELLRASLS